MEKKSTVGKSKSSNSAIYSRLDRDNKKSSSNNEIKPHSIKKRGVYVEKTLKPAADRVSHKPPKRPRPEQKKFLASVLSILSKSTAGTQYPEKDNSDRLKPRSRKTEDRLKSKKNKYKSRILNNNQEYEEIIILKSKKNIISHSPSTFSDKSKDELNKNSIKFVVENNIYSGVAEGAAKDVLKPPKCVKQFRIQDEPSSETDTDKKIYNFFVDLLETTFNVYNVKDGVDCETTDSKTRLEVDETVAQKLIIKNKSLPTDQKSNFTNEMDTEKNLFLNSFKEKALDVKISDHRPPKVKQKISDNTRKQKPLKSKSFDIPKNKHTRKPKKELLDILKEQLTRDAFNLEEPKNLYQALKIIAKNKKKCEKTIHNYDNNKFERFDKKECMFRRKVLIQSKKKNRKSDQKTPKLRSRSFEIKNDGNFPSRHSLEVYGYDYENPVKKNKEKPVKKHNIWFAVHSPSSISESDVYCSTVELHLNPSLINNR